MLLLGDGSAVDGWAVGGPFLVFATVLLVTTPGFFATPTTERLSKVDVLEEVRERSVLPARVERGCLDVTEMEEFRMVEVSVFNRLFVVVIVVFSFLCRRFSRSSASVSLRFIPEV